MDLRSRSYVGGGYRMWTKGFEMVKRNGSNLLGLVNRLLDMAKLETGKLKLSMKNDSLLLRLLGLSVGKKKKGMIMSLISSWEAHNYSNVFGYEKWG